MALFGNPNFTGPVAATSKAVYTDADLYRMAEEKAAAAAAKASSGQVRALANKNAKQDALAQQLVDYFSANPMNSRGVDNYAYGGTFDADPWAPGALYAIDPKFADPGGFGGTQFGSIEGVNN